MREIQANLPTRVKNILKKQMNPDYTEQRGEDKNFSPYEGQKESPIARRSQIIKKILSSAYGKGLSPYDFSPVLGLPSQEEAKVVFPAIRALVSCLATHIAFREGRADKKEFLTLAKRICSAKYVAYGMEDRFDLGLSALYSLDLQADSKKLAKVTARYAGSGTKRVLLLGQLFESVLSTPKEAKELTSAKGTFNSKGKTYIKNLTKAAKETLSIQAISTVQGGKASLGTQLNTLLTQENKTASETVDLASKVEELKLVLSNKEITIRERVEEFSNKLSEMNLTPEEESSIQAVLVAQGVDFISPKQSEIAKKLLLNSEQEEAMETKGLVKISAGAGAGKTRVLTAKVIKTIEEDNDVGLYNIIATSFTKDSSNDLRAKVEASMGSKTDLSTTFIGRTTHSIATELINKFNPAAASKTVLDTNSYQGKKFVLSCFDGIKPGNFATYVLKPVEAKYLLSEEVEEMEDAKQVLLSFVNSMLSSAQYGKYRDAEYDVATFDLLRKKITNGESIQEGEIAGVLDGLERYDEAVATGGGTPSKNRYVKNLEKILSGDISELGDEDEGMGTVVALKAMVKNYNDSLMGKKASSNWWELGLDLGNEKLPKKVKRLLSQRKLSLFITKAKSNVLSPEECFNNVVSNAGLTNKKLSEALKGKKNEKAISQIILSCAYKAYQVKLGETGQRDHDDTIIETVRLLKNDKVRKRLQDQYKHVIVDEAQDLNSAQHMMFGLIAGTYKTSKGADGKPVRNEKAKKADGEYSLIGDVKQSIYGFRGATPEQFNHGTSKEATTKDLTLNYRSGSSIVNRMNAFANTFLGNTETGAFCTPNYDKSKGQIKKVEKDTAEDAVAEFSTNIEEALKDPYGNDRFSDFGVAARTNAELIPYAFSLLEKGIPFRCGVNPFKMRVTSDIINIMKVLSKNERSRSWGMAYASKVFGYDFEKVGIEITDVANAIGDFLKEGSTSQDNWFNSILSMLSDPDDTAFLAAADVAEAYYDKCLSKIIALEGEDAAVIFNTILGYAGDSPLMASGERLCSKYKDNDQVAEELEKISAGQQDDEGEEGNDDINFTPISYLQKLFTQGVTTAGTYSREDDLAEGEAAVTYSMEKDIDTVLAKLDQMKADAEKASGQMRSAKDVDNDVVVLDTIHGWKGLETKHIYIPMVGGKFPSERLEYDYTTGTPNEAELKKRKLEEEARLAYVAVTRGKESANIITYKNKIVGDEQKAVKESEFLNHICIDENKS